MNLDHPTRIVLLPPATKDNDMPDAWRASIECAGWPENYAINIGGGRGNNVPKLGEYSWGASEVFTMALQTLAMMEAAQLERNLARWGLTVKDRQKAALLDPYCRGVWGRRAMIAGAYLLQAKQDDYFLPHGMYPSDPEFAIAMVMKAIAGKGNGP